MEEGPSPKRHRTVATQVDEEMLAEGHANHAANEGATEPQSERDDHEAVNACNGSGMRLAVPGCSMDGGAEQREGPGTLDEEDRGENDGPQEDQLPDLPSEPHAVEMDMGENPQGMGSLPEVAATITAEDDECDG